MLAGHAYDALKDVTAISRERKWTEMYNGAACLPFARVGKLSVVAK